MNFVHSSDDSFEELPPLGGDVPNPEHSKQESGDVSRPPSSYNSMVRRAEQEDQGTPRFISDPIHGQIEVPVVCQAIVDSMQFDRLEGRRRHYVVFS